MSLKNIVRKSIASLGAISLLFGNCSLCGIGLLEVIAENASVPEIGIEWTNEKYVQYSYNKTVEVEGQETDVEVKGVAVQSKLSVYPTYEQDTYLPTERVEFSVALPTINGVFPQKSVVVEASTKSTTGEESNTNFNQNYDSNSGLLTVSYENTPDENIYMEYSENAKDEFKIIYTYPSEAYTGNEEEINIQSSVNTKMTFKTENGSVATENTQSFEMVEKDNKGNILTFGVTELENKIYKGFMYSNVQNKTSHDTEFKTVSTFAVLNSEITNSVIMELKEAEFLLNDEEETKILTNGNVVYKSTKISKAEFDKMLGQDGVLEIYTEETLLATVKYIEVLENEETVKKLSVIYSDGEVRTLANEEAIIPVEYKQDVSSLKINISKPLTEGFIHFENQNAIKASSDYGCSVEAIEHISIEGSVNNCTYSPKIKLLEPSTKVSVTASNTNFSTLQNSKTTLTITLDDTNASAKLFGNPTITVKLPDGIVGGTIASTEIVNGNGLSVKKTSSAKNIITIELEGKQTSYDITNISGGATIVMEIENIDYADTIPTHEDKIEVICTQGDEEVKVSQNVNIVSKAGVLLQTKLSGFDNNSTLTSIDSKIKMIEIETNAEAKELEQTLNLVNNYDDRINNVAIIGRVDYSNEEITSTFETQLTKPIEITNGKVYYSTSTNANYNDASWTEEFIANAKSYKVELENNELASKDIYEIKLYINLPANLECNQENYLNCNVEYTYQERTMNDNVTLGMQTTKNELLTNYSFRRQNIETEWGETVPVSVSITPVIGQAYVHSGQIVTYKIKAVNNGQEDLENIVLTSNITDNAVYTYYQEVESPTGNYKKLVKDESIKQKEWTIDLLKAGDIAEVEMLLTMSNVTEEQEIVNSVNMTYNNQTTEKTESRLTLKPSKIQATLTGSDEKILRKTYKLGENLNYYIKVKNITDKTLKNVRIQYELPKEIEYIKGGIATYGEYEEYKIQEEIAINGNVFEYNINSLKVEEEKVICIAAKVKQLTENYSKQLENVARVYIENDIYETNIKTINIKQAMYEMSLNVDTKGKEVLSKNDEAIYTLVVQNIGENSGIVDINMVIPEELQVLKIEEKNNKEPSKVLGYINQRVSRNKVLNKNDIIELIITTKVREIEVESDTTLVAKNTATLKDGELEINSREVTINIKPELKVVNSENGEINGDLIKEETGTQVEPPTEKPTDESTDTPTVEQPDETIDTPTDEQPENTIKLYSISGLAWLDSNRDGKKDESENVQPNITVTLINKATGKYALDSNGNKITITTNNEGKYEFNNIKEGTYAVIFEFDSNKYTVTSYRKENVNEALNSDAILKKVTIDGQEKLVGLTDNIELNANKENINIGLVENATFDLSLDKQITKITVINSKGTETYEYEDGETAKVDLVAKYMNGANIIVNYKFTITNKGDVTGYVNSLVDNLPSGLEFSSELNKDWYKGSDGQLYTTALSNTEIKPGESTYIELVLTKNMTEDNAGIFPNNAKLEKISNLENIKEKTDALENNESSANLIISIKTGTIALYIGITTLCLLIICAGAYLIKKKVLNRGI